MTKAKLSAPRRPAARREAIAPSDAALVAVAGECAKLGALLIVKIGETDAAQTRQKRIDPPKALIRTESDMALGLFVGKAAIGKPYEHEDIALIRALVRRMSRADSDEKSYSAFERGREILEHWQTWREAVAEAEAESGYREAEAEQFDLQDSHDEALGKLIRLPAHTVEGVFAKARGFQTEFADDARLASNLADELRKFGADYQVLALSLAADLMRIVRNGEASQWSL